MGSSSMNAHLGPNWIKWATAVTAGIGLGFCLRGTRTVDRRYEVAVMVNKSEDKAAAAMGSGGSGGSPPPSRTYPLFVDAGQGTTATHSVHVGLCELGVPSVHFMRACYDKTDDDNAIDEQIERSVDDHWKVMDGWNALTACRDHPGCSFEEGVRLDQDLRDRIETVIRGGIGAVHDSPYPLYLSHVLEVAETLNDGAVVLLTSERPPEKWAASRIKTHKYVHFCKNPSATLDFPLCVELAKKEDPPPQNFGDIFIAADEFRGYQFPGKKGTDEFERIAAEGMRRYQERVLELNPAVRFQFFESKERMSSKKIGDMIMEKAKSIISPTYLWALSRPTTNTCIRKWDGTTCTKKGSAPLGRK
mmetsp:Transcript_27609/g.81193  ORF Transcript_27609/g.81193 Transcript_27609/m.81193 type:complete len:361 (-) Transcript_27609:98-1180(-)